MPILMYHHVGPAAPRGFEKYSVTPARLAAHLRWLRACGYRGSTLEDLLARWSCGADDENAVVITFDDGYRDCVVYGAPVLERFGFRATFFLVSGEMGCVASWLVRDRGVALPIMDWADARALRAAGFEVGAHSVSHPKLAEVDADTARAELRDSKTRIEDEIGVAVRHVAYPHGSYDARVASAARAAGYECACTTEPGIARRTDDRWALPRVPVDGRERIWNFAARVRTGRALREAVRGASGKASR